eukprot:CAMPEP_0117886468 /NCGR_PEP_ID=MMETSP0950-20121206/20376_1 /TAXON_ID=44440 /ORGANISM="Chattonella subsalsa, Strain CCMP2191" /LENGTH=81 /DNA_ID=CAMNT_0005743797 /DNA_START=325 /DNA_END=570 /DNA_ORIENTATION=-
MGCGASTGTRDDQKLLNAHVQESEQSETKSNFRYAVEDESHLRAERGKQITDALGEHEKAVNYNEVAKYDHKLHFYDMFCG